jgi:hypothetical protein
MALAWGRELEWRCGCVKLVHLHVVGGIQATTVLGGVLISGVGTKVEPCRGSRRPRQRMEMDAGEAQSV